MSYLPYTDGSNGNGLTVAAHLVEYVTKYPLALLDNGFMTSYLPLLVSNQPAAREVLALAAAMPPFCRQPWPADLAARLVAAQLAAH